jgi:hypothetical protein
MSNPSVEPFAEVLGEGLAARLPHASPAEPSLPRVPPARPQVEALIGPQRPAALAARLGPPPSVRVPLAKD